MPDSITTNPADVNMDPGELERASRLLDQIHNTGKYPALQVCIRRHGRIVLHKALGHYRPVGNPTNEWLGADRQTRFLLFSVSKCVIATATHMLLDDGDIRVDDPVHWYIPEFGKHGKRHITIRHLLTHSAGIPWIFWDVDEGIIQDWDHIIETLCDQEPDYFPGRFTAYHTLSGGYILAEIIQRITDLTIREFLSRRLCEPMGLDTLNYGVTEEWYEQTARIERVDNLPPAPITQLVCRIVDVDIPTALELINQPPVYESVIPSANIIATAEETNRFFQMLLDGGSYEDSQILSNCQVRRATSEQTVTQFDTTLLFTPQRYSLGFMLGRQSSEFNVFGSNTEETFGHLGFTRQLGWANPKTDIAGAFLTSGIPVSIGKDIYIIRQFQNAIREACY